MDKQTIQKYRNGLVMAGRALIIFGAWDVLYGITGILYKSTVIKMILDMIEPEMQDFAVAAAGVFIMIVYGIDFLLRVLIGTRAIREGRQKPGKHRFFMLCLVISCFYIVGIIDLIRNMHVDQMMYASILELIGNGISIYIYLHILFLTRKVRRYERESGVGIN